MVLPSSDIYFEKVWVISQSTLQGYLEHDDTDALLANLIFMTRIILLFRSTHAEDSVLKVSSMTLRELSKVDVQHASSELRHEYCDLWNVLVRQARDGTDPSAQMVAEDLLRPLRKNYNRLHDSTDAAHFLRPLLTMCTIPDHRRTSPQTLHLTRTTANLTNLPRPLSLLPDSIPPNAVAGALEDALNVSALAADLAIVPSSPTPPSPPLAPRSSVEIAPTQAVQEIHDVPMAQPDRTSPSPDLESPPDAGPAAIPDTTVTLG